MPQATIAILLSGQGRGSNMAALATACAAGSVPAKVGAVITSMADAPAVARARELGLRVEVVPFAGDDYGARLMSALGRSGAGWICLAGYMRLLPDIVLEGFPGRILNIHPALLPKFGGKGMYGLRVHQAVIDAGEKESGATVHLVNQAYDEGEIVLQARCPVLPDDTPETLAARVLSLEHRIYPEALRLMIEKYGS